MKNSIVIGIVVAMAAGVVITGSTLPAVSAQGNMTAGGGGIVQQLKSRDHFSTMTKKTISCSMK